MSAGGQRPRAVYKKVDLSRSESATLVKLVLKEFADQLEHGETVTHSARSWCGRRNHGWAEIQGPEKKCRSPHVR